MTWDSKIGNLERIGKISYDTLILEDLVHIKANFKLKVYSTHVQKANKKIQQCC